MDDPRNAEGRAIDFNSEEVVVPSPASSDVLQATVRTALQEAAFVAGLLVTTEAMVAKKPKPKAPPAMPRGGGMGDMDY